VTEKPGMTQASQMLANVGRTFPIITILLLIVHFCFRTVSAQDPALRLEPPKEVTVRSWKEGSARISSGKFTVFLSSKNDRFEKEITADTGEKFLLKFQHNPYSDLELEHWQIRFFKISADGKGHSADLFAVDKNEPGKHFFQKGDTVGVLYPRLGPFVFSDNGEPDFGDGYGFYFIRTNRKIVVEDFTVVISVGQLAFNKRKPNHVSAMEIAIEFRPGTGN
jgi:hypothetical protein